MERSNDGSNLSPSSLSQSPAIMQIADLICSSAYLRMIPVRVPQSATQALRVSASCTTYLYVCNQDLFLAPHASRDQCLSCAHLLGRAPPSADHPLDLPDTEQIRIYTSEDAGRRMVCVAWGVDNACRISGSLITPSGTTASMGTRWAA